MLSKSENIRNGTKFVSQNMPMSPMLRVRVKFIMPSVEITIKAYYLELMISSLKIPFFDSPGQSLGMPSLISYITLYPWHVPYSL